MNLNASSKFFSSREIINESNNNNNNNNDSLGNSKPPNKPPFDSSHNIPFNHTNKAYSTKLFLENELR